MKSVIFAVENGSTEKTDDVVFSNTYEAVTTSAVTTKVILEEPTIPKETEVEELPEERMALICILSFFDRQGIKFNASVFHHTNQECVQIWLL